MSAAEILSAFMEPHPRHRCRGCGSMNAERISAALMIAFLSCDYCDCRRSPHFHCAVIVLSLRFGGEAGDAGHEFVEEPRHVHADGDLHGLLDRVVEAGLRRRWCVRGSGRPRRPSC